MPSLPPFVRTTDSMSGPLKVLFTYLIRPGPVFLLTVFPEPLRASISTGPLNVSILILTRLTRTGKVISTPCPRRPPARVGRFIPIKEPTERVYESLTQCLHLFNTGGMSERVAYLRCAGVCQRYHSLLGKEKGCVRCCATVAATSKPKTTRRSSPPSGTTSCESTPPYPPPMSR